MGVYLEPREASVGARRLLGEREQRVAQGLARDCAHGGLLGPRRQW